MTPNSEASCLRDGKAAMQVQYNTIYMECTLGRQEKVMFAIGMSVEISINMITVYFSNHPLIICLKFVHTSALRSRVIISGTYTLLKSGVSCLWTSP